MSVDCDGCVADAEFVADVDGPIPPIVQRIERRNIISAESNILRRFSLTSTKIFVYSAGQSSVEGPAVRIVGTGLGFGIEYSDF